MSAAWFESQCACERTPRCERCTKPLTESFGRDSSPGCNTVCADCPDCDCTACMDVRNDDRMELLCQIEREAS